MRDIRNDLRERLAVLDGRQGDVLASYMEAREKLDNDHKEAIGVIEGERAALKQLLAMEDRRALESPAPGGAATATDSLVELAKTAGAPVIKTAFPPRIVGSTSIGAALHLAESRASAE
jgi:hypothetical protein